MHAVVSLFDKNDRSVRSLSGELEKTLGTRVYSMMPDPHLSYQGATKYNFAKLEGQLRRFAKRTHRFRVRAGGLGIFTGFTPTLYTPIVRTIELSRFQLSLWKSISSTGSGLNPYYKPEAWVPHITLARGISERTLTKAIRSLARKEIELDLKIDNLTVIEFDGKAHIVRSKFQLR
jgi:2'-5' RNA ligase